ncbi:hypothetical protein ABZS79_03520 [Streptomyces griseoloalbus]|uniref:hypothetical protein n=1 Tax=Streptomyces griseoloalbus TaxID=67303 RepID=UPI0033BE0D13
MMTSVIRTLAAAGIAAAAAAAALSVHGSGNALASVVNCGGCQSDPSGPQVTYNQSGSQRGQDGADAQGSYRVDGGGSETVQGGQGGAGIAGDGWNQMNYSTDPNTQHTVQRQGQDGADGRVETRTGEST